MARMRILNNVSWTRYLQSRLLHSVFALHDVHHTLLTLDILQISRTRVMGNFVYTRKESRALPASIDTKLYYVQTSYAEFH